MVCVSDLCHLKDALGVQTALSHLPHTCDSPSVRDWYQNTGHWTCFLLQGGIHHMSVTDLSDTKTIHHKCTNTHKERGKRGALWVPCTGLRYRERSPHRASCSHMGHLTAQSLCPPPHPQIIVLWKFWFRNRKERQVHHHFLRVTTT